MMLDEPMTDDTRLFVTAINSNAAKIASLASQLLRKTDLELSELLKFQKVVGEEGTDAHGDGPRQTD